MVARLNSSIQCFDLKEIFSDGGSVLHGIKKGDEGYIEFGEMYFSNIFEGSIKAWKLHKKMHMNLTVPFGDVRFVFLNEDGSLHSDITIGRANYKRIYVPPGYWFGFQGIGKGNNLVCNLSNIHHDPSESLRQEISFFNFDW